MNELALYVHLVGVLAFISGIVLAGVAFETARRREQPAEIALLLRLARIAVLLVAFGGALLLGFGLWLVRLEHRSYGDGWIVAALALYVVALALGGLGGQRPKQARALAARLAADRLPASRELRALLDDGPSRSANYASLVVVLGILALMVFKP